MRLTSSMPAILSVLFLVSCAGGSFMFEDRESGAKINIEDREVCADDGKRFGGCIKIPEEFRL